jgi:endonuclease YncB( thermonuclease family)
MKIISTRSLVVFAGGCLLIALAVSGIAASASPFGLAGKIVYVDDGDTVILLVDGHLQRKIRLSSIDAPESSHTPKERGRIGQPYADNSGRYLASLVKGKSVDAHCFEEDKYGRDVCEIFINEISINKEMVRQGWAWANAAARGRYLRDKSLLDLEASARLNHIGLWAGLNPIAPWEWRDECWKQGRCPL